jgi:hypothetical protein
MEVLKVGSLYCCLADVGSMAGRLQEGSS